MEPNILKECVKQNNHISSKLHTIYISSNNGRHPVTKNFTKLHPTTLHSTSLKLSTLHFLSFKLHPTALHSTSLQLSTLHFLSFKLHTTSLHYPLIWLNTFKFPTAPHKDIKNFYQNLSRISKFACNRAKISESSLHEDIIRFYCCRPHKIIVVQHSGSLYRRQ